MKRCAGALALMLVALVGLVAGRVGGDEKKDYVPKIGEFPPPDNGQYLVGELVAVDHINRRGAIRLAGDGIEDRDWAPSHKFAMLPYGSIRYHGAPAELCDIPLGTVLHGYFYLPPEGDTTIPRPTRDERFVPKYNHATSLEDDVSFYQRQGQAWKIVSVDLAKGLLKVTASGKPTTDGLTGAQTFDLDATAQVWKARQIGELKDLAPDQIVQLNLGWAPEWKNGQFRVLSIWLDKESLDLAAAHQRQVHLRYEKLHGLPAYIDRVEHQPGGKGIVTVTLFGGRDATLCDNFKMGRGLRIAAAETTLRTWQVEHDYKGGQIVEVKQLDNPPPGSSGIQLRLSCGELLEGFRPGRIVRLCSDSWPRIKLPVEERVRSLEDR